MKKHKVKDFQKKLSWFRQVAEYHEWEFVDSNIANGQIHFWKPGIHFNMWSTKMTVTITKNGRLSTYRDQNYNSIEQLFINTK